MPVPCSGGREQTVTLSSAILLKSGMAVEPTTIDPKSALPSLDRRSHGRSPVGVWNASMHQRNRSTSVLFSLPAIAWAGLTATGQVLQETLSVPKVEVHQIDLPIIASD